MEQKLKDNFFRKDWNEFGKVEVAGNMQNIDGIVVADRMEYWRKMIFCCCC